MDQGPQFIHLSPEDIAYMKAVSQAGFMSGQMSEHNRTAPVDTSDKHGLRAHLESAGHWESTHDEMNLQDLQALHDESHADNDVAPEDERERHTTVGGSHFHH
jgi:hypothetical protein